MLTYMQDTIQAYFESYGDNGQYYQLPVNDDDQSLPNDIIKGHEYETFNDHNYVTKRPN